MQSLISPCKIKKKKKGEKERKKDKRKKEVITAEGIRIWSPSQVETPPNRA